MDGSECAPENCYERMQMAKGTTEKEKRNEFLWRKISNLEICWITSLPRQHIVRQEWPSTRWICVIWDEKVWTKEANGEWRVWRKWGNVPADWTETHCNLLKCLMTAPFNGHGHGVHDRPFHLCLSPNNRPPVCATCAQRPRAYGI